MSVDYWQLDAEVNHTLARSYKPTTTKPSQSSFAERIRLYNAHNSNLNRHLAADASDQTKFYASIRPSKE